MTLGELRQSSEFTDKLPHTVLDSERIAILEGNVDAEGLRSLGRKSDYVAIFTNVDRVFLQGIAPAGELVRSAEAGAEERASVYAMKELVNAELKRGAPTQVAEGEGNIDARSTWFKKRHT